MVNQIRTILSVIIIIALLLGSGLPFGEQPAAAADEEVLDLPPIELPEKGNPKLDSQLNQLVSAETPEEAASFAHRSNIKLVEDNVRVIVECMPGQLDAATEAATALGASVETSYRNLLQIVVPISQLTALAEEPSIHLVRLPWYPLPEVVSEGHTVFEPTALAPVLGWDEHGISGDFGNATHIYATDVDGDGNVDVLGASAYAGIAWWENDGSGNFTEHTIADIAGTLDWFNSVYASDVDGDGDVDVLGATGAAGVAWWENDGSQNFTEHTIADSFNGARSVYATDVDGDGDIDVLGAASVADEITWWENDGSQSFTEHIIAGAFDGANSVYASDVDNDGDIDVLGTAQWLGDVAWWENGGSQNFTEHTIAGSFGQPKSVYATDVDGDGDIDVLGASWSPDIASQVTWWENLGPELQLSAATYSVAENAGSATVTVTRTGGAGTVMVDYATSDGSATAGSDYTSTSGTITFADGDSADKTFIILIIDDNLVEGDETVNLTLSNPTGNAVLGTPNTAVLIIIENELGLADTPWPMFQHDPQHTGRSPYIGPEVPAKKWSFTTGYDVFSSPVIGANGTIYIGANDGKLYAINPDGTERWSFSTGGDVSSSPAVGADGTIYVGSSHSQRLYAINPNGSENWSFSAGGYVSSSPAIGADGTIYVGSVQSQNLHAINHDGTLKWSFATGGHVSSSPAIGADGTIYVGSADNKLYAINTTGTEKWSFTTGSSIYSSPAIGADGTIYVGSWDGKLYAINPDGSQKWSFTTGGIVDRSSPAIGADGTIYVGSADNKLYAINTTGTENWSFTTGGHIYSSPALDANGTIYVGSWDGKLYAINPDGSQKWSFATGDDVYSSPAIDADGTIYVGSQDHKLYAIEEYEPVTSEGVGLINADEWQSAGYTGAGVKIAILDGGFTGYLSLLGTELPASVITQSFYAGSDIEGYTAHGTACAEIVYDIAPDAQLYLVNSGTGVELGNAVDWLITQGVDVISYSVGWSVGGPGDGTGPIAEIVDAARAAGILWVNAIGNSAQRHWQGDFVDNIDDGYHEFDPSGDISNAITVSSGNPIIVELKWDDTWGSSGNDYDLLLVDKDSNLVALSNYEQNGNDYPIEGFGYTATYSGIYHIIIASYASNEMANFHLYSWYHYLQYQVASSSLMVPADSPNAMAVGAVPWDNPTTLESFSSQGPTEAGLIKPDLVAPDGVTSATYSPFYGTSASAPHAAGAAALVKERYPSYTPAEIQTFLEDRAVDLGAAGKDNLYGSGRLQLGSLYPDIRTPIDAIDFGDVAVGGNTNKTTTIYNDGTSVLTINSITKESGSDEFTYVGLVTPFDIAAGESQVITLRFAPTSGGLKSATFNVNSNDPDKPVVTFEVSGNGVSSVALRIVVTLQGRPTPPDERWIIPVDVWLHAPGDPWTEAEGNGSLFHFETQTSNEGVIELMVVPGTYDIRVKGLTTLKNLVTGVEVNPPGPVEVNLGTLIEGDVNGDNMVTGLDYSAVIMCFGYAVDDPGAPGPTPNSDFNNDGYVTGLDYSRIITNFGLGGADIQ